MKNKREFKVPLSGKLIEWLNQLPQLDALVFPGQKGKSLSDATLLALLKRMEYWDDTTTHGLRSTFSTWAHNKTQHEHNIIEAALSHITGSKVSQAYNRGELLEKRKKLMLDWHRYLGFVPAADPSQIPSP